MRPPDGVNFALSQVEAATDAKTSAQSSKGSYFRSGNDLLVARRRMHLDRDLVGIVQYSARRMASDWVRVLRALLDHLLDMGGEGCGFERNPA